MVVAAQAADRDGALLGLALADHQQQREFSDETGDRAGELVERERNCRADAVGQELAMHLEVAPERTIKQVRAVTMM